MSVENQWEQFIHVMEQIHCLLDEYTETSEKLRESLYGRNWLELENSVKHMENIASHMETLERERFSLSKALIGECGETAEIQEKKIVDLLIKNLPQEKRDRFHSVRRELKNKLIAVKIKARGLADYAEFKAELGKDLMEELVPEARNRTYNRAGQKAPVGEHKPLVVSHNL